MYSAAAIGIFDTIDELLERPGYAAWWATKLSDFTGNSPQQIRVNNLPRGANLSGMWYDWIEHRVAENVSYDKIVEGIVMGASRTSPDQTFEEMCEEMGSYFRDKNKKDFVDRETMPFFWARRNLRQPEAKAIGADAQVAGGQQHSELRGLGCRRRGRRVHGLRRRRHGRRLRWTATATRHHQHDGTTQDHQ